MKGGGRYELSRDYLVDWLGCDIDVIVDAVGLGVGQEDNI